MSLNLQTSNVSEVISPFENWILRRQVRHGNPTITEGLPSVTFHQS